METLNSTLPGPTTEEGTENGTGRLRQRAKLSWVRIGVPVILAVLGFGLPSFVHVSQLSVAVDAMILGLFALSLGWLLNKAGMVSLGHGAFYGLSAYTIAISATQWGWNLTVASLVGILVGTVFAFLVALVSIRVTGIGFAMVTLAFGQALYLLALHQDMRELTSGEDGMIVPPGDFLWLTGDELFAEHLWPIVWACVIAAVLLLALVNRSRFGVLTEAIRDNEERARFSGFSTYLPRVLAFTISGFIASVAGALAAVSVGFVSPQLLFWMLTAYGIIAAVIGGTKSLYGPFIGAVIYTQMNYNFASTGNAELLLGIVFVVVMAIAPAGLMGLLGLISRRASHRIQRKESAK